MEKKSSKEHSVVFLVKGEKFNLGERNSAIKFRQKVQIYLVGSVQTRSAHRLSSQLFAAVSTPNIAELVLLGFSVHKHGFYGVSNTFCQEKHQHFHADRQLVTKKEISIKINYENNVKRPWPSGLVTPTSRVRHSAGARIFFFFFSLFLFFNKTTWMRVFSEINNCQQKQNKKTKQKTKAKNRQNKKGGSAFRLG